MNGLTNSLTLDCVLWNYKIYTFVSFKLDLDFFSELNKFL